jgi:hypothetical protein
MIPTNPKEYYNFWSSGYLTKIPWEELAPSTKDWWTLQYNIRYNKEKITLS